MSRAYRHELTLLSLFLIFLISGPLVFAAKMSSVSVDTMTVFHEVENPKQQEKQYNLESSDGLWSFKVTFFDRHEPHSKPYDLEVGFKYRDYDVQRVDRRFKNGEALTYCGYDPLGPELMTRESFAELQDIDLSTVGPDEPLATPGMYLVIPVYQFDDEAQVCNLDRGIVDFEVISLEGLREKILSEDEAFEGL